MVPPLKLARLLATEPLLAAALAAPGSAVNLQCDQTSPVYISDILHVNLKSLWCIANLLHHA